MKKIVLIGILLLLTGCGSYIELGELDVVETLGIDYQQDTFQITIQTKEKEEKQMIYKTTTATGKTLTEAVENIKTKKDKKLYLEHLNVLLLSENAINYKLEEILTYFLKNAESRNDFTVALTPSLDFLKENDKNIKDMIKIVQKETGTTKEIEFEEFLKDLLEEEFSILPVIDQTEEETGINSIAIIHKNKVGLHLTKEECILYNLLENTLTKANYQEMPLTNTKTIYLFRNQKLQIRINIHLPFENKKLPQSLKNDLEEMVQKYKEEGLDIFHIKKQLKKTSPKFYQKKEEKELDEIHIEWNIKTKNETKERTN